MLVAEARAFRRPAPTACAEALTHPLVAHDASDQVTAAARQVHLHRVPRIRARHFAMFRNRRTDARSGATLCKPWGSGRCSRRRWALIRACTLRRGNGHRPWTRSGGRRCLGGDSGRWRLEGRVHLRFHRLRLRGPRGRRLRLHGPRLHSRGHGGRRRARAGLSSIARLRGGFLRAVGRHCIDVVHRIRTCDEHHRRNGQQELSWPHQAPIGSQRGGDKHGLRPDCGDGCVGCCRAGRRGRRGSHS